MRASRAGLILTPHRTTERGGPTSLARQEARPLVLLPILELVAVGSHGGAAGRLHERSREKNKGLTEGKDETAKIPYSPYFPPRRTNYKSPPLDQIVSLFEFVINSTYFAVKAALNVFSHSHRLAVTETDDDADPSVRQTARAGCRPRLFTQPANHRVVSVAGRRQGTEERIKQIKQTKRKERKQGGGENRKNTRHKNTALTASGINVHASSLFIYVFPLLTLMIGCTLLLWKVLIGLPPISAALSHVNIRVI